MSGGSTPGSKSSVYGVLILSTDSDSTISRNTFRMSGPSETILVGEPGTIAEFNFFEKVGYSQTDGAAIHAYKTATDRTVLRCV